MISQKKKTCKICGEQKYIFSKELCQICFNKNSKIKSSKKGIRKITDTKKEEKNKQKEKRDVYFDYHIERCKYSEESSEFINNPTKANICHIFPKRKYKSLEDHLENYVYLTFKEHERLDYLLYNHKFEEIEKEFKNSYKVIWLRAKKLLPLCLENGVFFSAIKKYLDGK